MHPIPEVSSMKNFHTRLLAALGGFIILCSLSTVHAGGRGEYTRYVPRGDGGPTETTDGHTGHTYVQWYPCANAEPTHANFSSEGVLFCSNNVLIDQPFGGYECNTTDPGITSGKKTFTAWCLGVRQPPCPQDNKGSNSIKNLAGKYYLTVSDENVNHNGYGAYVAGGIVTINGSGDIVFTVAGNNNAPLQYYDNIHQAIPGRVQGDFTDHITTLRPVKVGDTASWQDVKNSAVSLQGTLECGNPTQIDGTWVDSDHSGHGGVFDLTLTYPNFP
jgi:hypothetical protein